MSQEETIKYFRGLKYAIPSAVLGLGLLYILEITISLPDIKLLGLIDSSNVVFGVLCLSVNFILDIGNQVLRKLGFTPFESL